MRKRGNTFSQSSELKVRAGAREYIRINFSSGHIQLAAAVNYGCFICLLRRLLCLPPNLTPGGGLKAPLDDITVDAACIMVISVVNDLYCF